MASRPFQFLERKRSKIRKRAAKHFEGLAALSTHSAGRRAAVKAGCNITGLNVLNHLLKAGTVEVCTCITIIHIEFGIRKMMVFGIFGKQLFLESGLSRGDYPNYIFFECVNYPLSICSDGRQ